MLELEHGIVKRFDNRAGKQFGYLTVLDKDGKPTGEELWFHANDGQWVETVGDDIEFVGRNFSDGGQPIHMPVAGNKLAFSRAPGKDGQDKASPWTHAEAYDNRVKKLSEPRYRVIHVLTCGADGTNKEEVIWSCQGSDELSREFPLRVIEGMLLDQLAPTVNPETLDKHNFRFEMWVGPVTANGLHDMPAFQTEGYWRECDDPRYRSPAVQDAQVIS